MTRNRGEDHAAHRGSGLVICTDIPSATLRCNASHIGAARCQIFGHGNSIELTPMEFGVFYLLAQRPEHAFSMRVLHALVDSPP